MQKLILKNMIGPLTTAYQNPLVNSGDSPVVLKLFTPWTNCTWYITEGWPLLEDGEPIAEDRLDAIKDPNAYNWHLYGFGDLGDRECAELGYIDFNELKAVKGPFGLKIERDTGYHGHTLAEVLAKYGRIAA